MIRQLEVTCRECERPCGMDRFGRKRWGQIRGYEPGRWPRMGEPSVTHAQLESRSDATRKLERRSRRQGRGRRRLDLGKSEWAHSWHRRSRVQEPRKRPGPSRPSARSERIPGVRHTPEPGRNTTGRPESEPSRSAGPRGPRSTQPGSRRTERLRRRRPCRPPIRERSTRLL